MFPLSPLRPGNSDCELIRHRQIVWCWRVIAYFATVDNIVCHTQPRLGLKYNNPVCNAGCLTHFYRNFGGIFAFKAKIMTKLVLQEILIVLPETKEKI